MSAPGSGSPGQPAASQPGTGQAADSPAVPRQAGPGEAGQHAAPPRRPEPGMATVEERVAMGRLAQMGDRAWMILFVTALATIAVGILLLAWPAETLTIGAVLLGAGLVISGLYRLFVGFLSTELSGGTRAAYVVIGLIAGLAGLYCLRHRDVSVFLLALIVGAFWIIHGFADLGAAASAGRVPGRGLRVVGGLFSIAAGAIVLFWPGISLTIMLFAFGAWLCFYGALLVGLSLQMRRAAKHLARDTGRDAARAPA
jgi:uncharacterized membrane protein HdeD (DUF308 family)